MLEAQHSILLKILHLHSVCSFCPDTPLYGINIRVVLPGAHTIRAYTRALRCFVQHAFVSLLYFFFVCLWYYFGCHSHNRKSLDIETRFLPFWYNIVYRLPHTNGFWRIRTHQKWSAKKNNETHVIKEWFFVISCFDCCCSRCFFSLSHFILLIWPFVWLKFGWSQWISIDRTIFALCVFLCLSHLLLVLLYRFTGPPK